MAKDHQMLTLLSWPTNADDKTVVQREKAAFPTPHSDLVTWAQGSVH